MATRLYLSSTDVPGVSPTFDGSWEVTTSAIRRTLTGNKQNEAMGTAALATNSNTPAGAVDRLIAQFTSQPLSGAQTIAGNIKGQIRTLEDNAAANMRMQCVIWVMTSAGANRGTLIASSGAALSSEWNTGTLQNRYIPLGGSTAPTSVAAQDGDRIVVELGFRKHESATTNRTGSLRIGATEGVSDLPENETDTTDSLPWVEFADTLTFTAAVARVSQEATEVVIAPDGTNMAGRVSQLATEVVIQPTDMKARVSQIAVEVLRPRVPATYTPSTQVVIVGLEGP